VRLEQTLFFELHRVAGPSAANRLKKELRAQDKGIERTGGRAFTIDWKGRYRIEGAAPTGPSYLSYGP
jgi:hypothetical protein